MDELRENSVDIDKTTLSRYINEILVRQEEVYGEMAIQLNPEDLPCVFTNVNVINIGRAMAYLTLVYLMNISEDAKREAVRLVAVVLKDMNITRVE